MNFTKLAKYFTWKLPNSEKINISDFINILGNIWIDSEVLKDFENKFWSVSKDYKDLFEKIKWKWDWNIYKILDYFELPKSFVEEVDYSNYSIDDPKQSVIVDKKLYDLKLIEDFLSKANEAEFARYLMIPILEEMWFINLSFYWSVNKKDYWIDMYPIYFENPQWDILKLWIQFKAVNLSNWDSNPDWQTLSSEIKSALITKNLEHCSLNWTKEKIDWYFIFTSKKKTAFDIDDDLNREYRSTFIRVYDKEDVIKWCQKYKLPINLESNIIKISEREDTKKKSTKKTKK